MIVLDVNAAIAIAKGTEEGRALRELMIEGEEVIAPHFFLTELGNVVWQIVRAGELGEEDFPLLFERAAGFVDRFVPAEDILLEAIHAAIQNNHPVYDMLIFHCYAAQCCYALHVRQEAASCLQRLMV